MNVTEELSLSFIIYKIMEQNIEVALKPTRPAYVAVNIKGFCVSMSIFLHTNLVQLFNHSSFLTEII